MNTPNPNTLRILLADHQISFIEGLASFIETHHPSIKVVGLANSMSQTIDLGISEKPDVIVIDPNFEESDSIEIINNLHKFKDYKLLVLTDQNAPNFHQELIMNGVQGIVLKEQSITVIIKAIEKISAGEIWASKTVLGSVFDKFTHSPQNNGNNSETKKISDLTPREKEIISTLLSLESSTNEEIADHLCISQSTLKNHLTTIYSKLEVKNRVHLIKYALTHHLRLAALKLLLLSKQDFFPINLGLNSFVSLFICL